MERGVRAQDGNTIPCCPVHWIVKKLADCSHFAGSVRWRDKFASPYPICANTQMSLAIYVVLNKILITSSKSKNWFSTQYLFDRNFFGRLKNNQNYGRKIRYLSTTITRNCICCIRFASTFDVGTLYRCRSLVNSFSGVVKDWYVVMNVCKYLLSLCFFGGGGEIFTLVYLKRQREGRKA